MALYQSPSLVLSGDEAAFPEGTPLIGYHDLVEVGNITSTTAASGTPVTNLANPATHLIWASNTTSGYEHITVTTNTADEIDYVGVAQHNFGSGGIAVLVEGGNNDTFNKVVLHFDGADASTTITDSNTGGSAHTWTAAGNAQIDTAQSKFGGASLLCDGTGDWVTTPDNADFTLGSGDWTIQCWFNRNGGDGTFRWLGGQGDGVTATNRGSMIFLSSANVIVGATFVGSTAFLITSTTTFTATGWHHVAFVRTGNILKLFIDGTQEGGDVAIAGTVNNCTTVYGIGVEGSVGGVSWNGWIDEFQLHVGVALYTENFNPPTAAWDGYLYESLADEFMPADDSPILVQWTPTAYSKVRVALTQSGTQATAAVMYVGKLLILERSLDINPEHTPINQGRVTKVVNGLSTGGAFTGRIVVSETRRSEAVFKWFTPTFYRESIDPFVIHSQEFPFFWVWYPSEYPTDVGYVWITEDIQPEVDPVTQRVHMTIKMQGIA